MKQPPNDWTRREFVTRAALAWPLFHLGGQALAASRTARHADFHTIALPTSRLDEQRAFYRDVLHFPLVDEDAGSVTFFGGTTRMRFFLDESVGKPLYHFAFNIPTNKIESCMQWMDRKAPLLPHRETGDPLVHFRHIDAHSIYFFDPSGNLVEFIARHELDNPRRGKFDVEDVLNASEIGVVSDDVQSTADELDRELGLTTYSGGTSDAFRAVGAAQGVFIVVRRGRTWLMTDVPAVPRPVEVTLGNLGGGRAAGLSLKTTDCRIRAA